MNETQTTDNSLYPEINSLNTQPLHLQIRQRLLLEHRKMGSPNGTPFPSSRNLVSRFRTSKVTIDKAVKELKDAGLITSYPRKGILWGKNERISIYKTIGISVPVVGDISRQTSPYYYAMIEGMRNVFSSNGYDIKLLRDSLFSSRALDGICCDGVICAGTHLDSIRQVKNFRSLNMPYMLLDRPCDDDSLHCVERDSEENIYDITQFLISKGHKDIGMISMDSDWWIYEKIQRGFCRAMEQNKSDCLNNIWKLKKADNFYFEKPYKKSFTAFCKKHTAFIIVEPHREFREYFFQIFRESDMQVPDHNSVVTLAYEEPLKTGCDKISYFPITPEKMGKKVAQGFLNILEGKTGNPVLTFSTKIKKSV